MTMERNEFRSIFPIVVDDLVRERPEPGEDVEDVVAGTMALAERRATLL